MKTPTIKELRALANRKGYAFIKVYRLPQDEGDKRVFFFTTTSELGGSTTVDITSGRKSNVSVILLGFLRALPDKKVAR